VILFDPIGQYKPEPGELVVDNPEELKGVLREAGRYGEFKVLYQPRARSGRILDHWRKVGVMAFAQGNMLLCIDEMGLLCEDGQFRKDTPASVKNVDPILEAITFQGRHRKLDVICTAQRPTNIARGYTSMCQEMRIFQTSEKNDLTYLQSAVGESTVRRLPALPKYTFLHWTDEGVAIFKPKLER
jgi:hypothetical protein